MCSKDTNCCFACFFPISIHFVKKEISEGPAVVNTGHKNKDRTQAPIGMLTPSTEQIV